MFTKTLNIKERLPVQILKINVAIYITCPILKPFNLFLYRAKLLKLVLGMQILLFRVFCLDFII